MEEEIKFYLQESEESMKSAVEHTITALSKIRAGKAMPAMLDGLMVEYYGTPTPIAQVASISTGDARTILVKPWEKSVLQDVERAIINGNLGLNPQNDGEIIRIHIPALTEERRRDLVKMVKSEGENGKISLRNSRKETNDELKKLQKDGASEDAIKNAEDSVQELTNKYSKSIDSLIDKKEKDIMTI
jgi:ribosome recycling factor